MKKKNIEEIMQELIKKVLEEGKRPESIVLTQERYDELCNKFQKLERHIYEKVSSGFVYHERLDPPRIDKYQGIEVRIGSEIRIIAY